MTTNIPSLMSLPAVLPADATDANTYTDLNGLAALKRDPTSTASIDAVAQQVEAMFLQMMLKSMRDASMGDELEGGAVGMYQDLFDKQIALTISQHQDIGIGALLKRQLTQRGGTSVNVAEAAKTAQLQTPATTPAEFINRVMPAIERAAGELGVDPRGILAQAALETGWGQRMPVTAEGRSSHNLFGIKAGAEWAGARVSADTVEFNQGVASQRRTAFRAYDSIDDSVRDFAQLLKNSPRYREVVAAGGDVQSYVLGMAKAGYATDPDYGDKLNHILNSGAFQAALVPRTVKL